MRGDERTMYEIEVFRRLRAALGETDKPGCCCDCGGSGVIPDSEGTQPTGPGVWQTCPTCEGQGKGGIS
jgi:DnaJ-class molecular chaperone